MGKEQGYPYDDPLAECLASDPVPGPLGARASVTRWIRSLLVATWIFGLLLSVASVYPEATGIGIVVGIFVAYFAAPPALLAHRIVRSLIAQGEAMSTEDRLAAFLCMAIFTVPPQMIVLAVLFAATGGMD
jgi:hypothetical protein